MNHIQRSLQIASVSIVLVIFVIIGCLRTNELSIHGDEHDREGKGEDEHN